MSKKLKLLIESQAAEYQTQTGFDVFSDLTILKAGRDTEVLVRFKDFGLIKSQYGNTLDWNLSTALGIDVYIKYHKKTVAQIKSIQSAFREKGIAKKEAIIKLGLADVIGNETEIDIISTQRILIDAERSKIIASKIQYGGIIPDSTNLPIYEELMASGNINKIISDGVVLKHFPQRIWSQLEIYGPGVEGRKLWDWRIES